LQEKKQDEKVAASGPSRAQVGNGKRFAKSDGLPIGSRLEL